MPPYIVTVTDDMQVEAMLRQVFDGLPVELVFADGLTRLLFLLQSRSPHLLILDTRAFGIEHWLQNSLGDFYGPVWIVRETALELEDGTQVALTYNETLKTRLVSDRDTLLRHLISFTAEAEPPEAAPKPAEEIAIEDDEYNVEYDEDDYRGGGISPDMLNDWLAGEDLKPQPIPPSPPPRPTTPITPLPPPAATTDGIPAPPPAAPGAPPAPTTEPPRQQEAKPPNEVQFSTYYPKEMRPDDWQPLIAYLFRQTAADKVADDANQQLGERKSAFRRMVDAARQIISEGATVTATPEMPGFQFNPPSISVGFFEDWHRFDFKLRAKTAPLNQATNGRLTFTVEGLIVADLPLSIFVSENPSVGGEPPAAVTVSPYRAVFASYSRKDKRIVERVERAYRVLGMDYLRDLVTIRSGENWSDALQTMITRADVFQLFWSTTSSSSKHVQMEWEYALKLAAQRPNFIRPVYWEEPIPPVPEVLGHIHFTFQPDLDD
jgi:hypothetical protein